MLPTEEFAGWRIAVVESDRFGGTCLNGGCIPSKMLVHTADVAQTVRHAARFGIGAQWAEQALLALEASGPHGTRVRRHRIGWRAGRAR